MRKIAAIALLVFVAFASGYAQGTRISARYPEVGAVDVTTDQDLGLTIAFKLARIAATPSDPSLPIPGPTTPGEYLATRVADLIASYSKTHVTGEQDTRLKDALATADDQKRQQVAAVLGVDLTVVPPVTPVVKP